MAPLSRNETAFRLLILRKAFELSQEEIGEKAGIGKTGWSNYESAGQDRLIDVLVAARLCDRYGVTLDWIYRNVALGIPENVMQRIDKAEKEIANGHSGNSPVRLRNKRAKPVGKSRRQA